MTTTDELRQSLSDVFLGGIIEDVVVIVDDDTAYITAMDLSSALFVQTVADFKFKDDTLGIGGLGLFIKYLNSVRGVEVKVKRKDNRLHINPKKGGKLHWLLVDADLVPTYNEEWEGEGNIVEGELAEFGDNSSFKLTQENVSEFLKYMGMFTPSNVHININSRGTVIFQGGSSANEHQFEVPMGSIEDARECSVCIHGKHLTAVLSAMQFDNHPKFHVEDGQEAIIVETDSTTWLLRSTAEEGE